MAGAQHGELAKNAEYQELYEYACHEGNYNSMSDMLNGARAMEKAAGAAPKD